MNFDNIENQKVKTILQFAIPSIIAMILTSMINIIDGYFVGNYIGTEGIAAINLGLPIVYIYLGIGLMVAVGGISIAGRMLGAKQIKEANQVFRQTVAFCVILTIVVSVIMFFVIDVIAEMYDINEVTKEYFTTYYKILIIELPVMVLVSTFGMFIRGEGNPIFVMLSNVLAVILNIILDYLFVGPLELGISGIAWASVIAASVVMLINIIYFLSKSKVFKFGRFEINVAIIKDTILNGSSEMIGELSMCISMAAYNVAILHQAGENGLAAFTIIGYVSYVFSMIIVGFGQGIVPLISYSYGSKNFKLAREIRNITIKMVMGVAVVTLVVMTICTDWYAGLFSDSEKVIDLVIVGLRIQMTSFIFAGINTIVSFYFTSIGKAKESAIISASRGLIVLLIAIYVLPMIFGITGIWFVSLVTEVITIVFSVLYMQQNTKLENKLEIATV